jgi:hypothetical protein
MVELSVGNFAVFVIITHVIPDQPKQPAGGILIS